MHFEAAEGLMRSLCIPNVILVVQDRDIFPRQSCLDVSILSRTLVMQHFLLRRWDRKESRGFLATFDTVFLSASGRHGASRPSERGHPIERQPRAAEGDPEERRQLHLRRLQRRGRHLEQRSATRHHV